MVDENLLPLTRVVGGNINLRSLIKELSEMYPDEYPDYSISERELAYRAGAITVIRYLQSKIDVS